MTDSVTGLLADQDGVVARRQVKALGLTQADLDRLVRRRQWARVHPGVYVEHTGPLSWQQRAWAAVLFSWPAALSHSSALRAVEGAAGPSARGLGTSERIVHVGVERHRHLVAPAGVRVHRVTGLTERALWSLGPPRMRYEDAVLDVAGAVPGDIDALGILAGACGSRRTTAPRLLECLAGRARVPRRTWLEAVLTDVAQGTSSVLEHGYLAWVERPHGLPRVDRQSREVTSLGVVYRDAAYRHGVVVELDGRLFHDGVRQRDADHERDLLAAVGGRITVRVSYGQVFDRPCHTAHAVATLLHQRGWRGSTRPCAPACPAAAPLTRQCG